MNYEKAYKEAVSKIKSIIADKKKQGLTNCLFEGDLNEIFPELKENDEMIRKELIRYLPYCDDISKDTKERWIAWLEKQGEQKHVLPGFEEQEGVAGKDYIPVEWVETIENYGKWKIVKTDEQKPAWSEEDEKYINDILSILLGGRGYRSNGQIEEWLKSIKNRVGCEVNCTTIKQWSESDENRFNNLCEIINENEFWGHASKEGFINWLKSLKPQPHWKPTQAQMNALKIVKNGFPADDLDAIESLCNDLKKL